MLDRTCTLILELVVPNTSTQKHVNFASPPAVPISPASYPSSPESTRHSPGFAYAQPGTSDTSQYSDAFHQDPFQEQTPTDEHDRAIEEAARNAKANNATGSGVGIPTTAHQANVRDTLSRFSSAPRRASNKIEENKKPTMDVNAFTRLLLTGESGSGLPTPSTTTPHDSGSSTDTTSTSQRSVYDAASRQVGDSPTSSSEDETNVLPLTKETKKPPPPPKSRHGKSVVDSEPGNVPELTQGNGSATEEQAGIATQLQPTVPAEAEPARPSSSSKKPPPPPLARRKSQKSTPARPDMERNSSSKYSLNSESDEPASPSPGLGSAKMAPPPPPSRRTQPQYIRRSSTDLPATHEEDEDGADRPAMSNKRISQASLGPRPPVPPPRKSRTSGRSSMDSQHRPSLSALGIAGGSARSSAEYARPGSDSRNVSGSSAVDILADLDALQREVDAARASAGR